MRLALAVVLLLASPAFGAEGVLVPMAQEKAIIVWRTAAAVNEGRALIRAGADPKSIVPLVACAPPAGTPAVEAAEDPGLYLRGVIIATGKWAGCRGVVPKENFRTK